jgi:thiamine biosynthesis lipoprotein
VVRPLCGFLLFLLSLLVLGGCERKDHLVEQHLLEFGTIIKITLITQDLIQAEALLAEIESRLKTYRNQWHAWEESDLTRFNQSLAKGENAAIPRSLQPLLQLSHEYHSATRGLFNPALGKLIAAYGFHGSDININRINAIKSNLPDMDDLEINGLVANSRNPHLQIDLGGIAKGYAIGLIGDFLDENEITNYIVNAGGDLVTSGSRFGKSWRIGIQNPYAPGIIAGINIKGKYSLFTSGNYQRQYRQGMVKTHHIIDPRSGEPSRGQSSATVLMRNPVRADVSATTLMVDGVNGHKLLSDALGIDDYLIITEAREILSSRSMAEKLDFTTHWPIKIVN